MSRLLGFLSRPIALAALAMFGSASFAPALAAGLPRIVSMNVCTDQLLIPPDRIG